MSLSRLVMHILTQAYVPGAAAICDPERLQHCAYPASADWIRYHSQKLVCPRSCVRTEYEFRLSMGRASNHIMDYLGEHVYGPGSRDLLLEDYVMMDLFYPALVYELVEVLPAYGWFDMFCDIGGALGLVLGSAVLTFCEVVDFLLLCAWRACGRGGRVQHSDNN